MNLFLREAELRDQFEKNQVQFILTELATGITFCNVAKSASNPEKMKRNTTNAREAHDTALHFRRGAHFDDDTKTKFETGMAQLKSLLKELGEHV
jgi:hypothetical protein